MGLGYGLYIIGWLALRNPVSESGSCIMIHDFSKCTYESINVVKATTEASMHVIL
jgi:hypothetical protein